MEITRTAKNTMPEQVQENMGNIDALNNELENRPVGLIDKGDWTRGRHYYPQQVVQYNGASYLCTRSIISLATPDTDPLHFKLFASGSQGEQGETGNGIASITKISTVGLVDTYRITFTDGTTYDYTVTNGQNGTNGTNGQDGNGIASITKISTVGLVDTYRITFTDGTYFDYTLTNGTTISVNGVQQSSVSFDSDPQTQIDNINVNKQDKIDDTWNAATKNTTYVDTNGGCYYKKIGNLVIGRFSDVVFKATNQPNGATIFSGLPNPVSGWDVFNVTCFGGTHKTARYEINGTSIKNYWSSFTPSTDQKWSCVFVYTTDET